MRLIDTLGKVTAVNVTTRARGVETCRTGLADLGIDIDPEFGDREMKVVSPITGDSESKQHPHWQEVSVSMINRWNETIKLTKEDVKRKSGSCSSKRDYYCDY